MTSAFFADQIFTRSTSSASSSSSLEISNKFEKRLSSLKEEKLSNNKFIDKIRDSELISIQKERENYFKKKRSYLSSQFGLRKKDGNDIQSISNSEKGTCQLKKQADLVYDIILTKKDASNFSRILKNPLNNREEYNQVEMNI
jgi:hypothetical protein